MPTGGARVMNRALLWIGIIALLQGCALLTGVNKQQVKDQLTMKAELAVQERTMAKAQALTLAVQDRRDSTVAIAELEIWPRGVFSFSSERGFEGEAERVLWHGQNMALKSQQEKLWHKADVEQSKVLQVDQAQQQQLQQQVKGSQTSWKGIWVLGVILLLALAFFLGWSVLGRGKWL
jgi:hypothetical protein